MEAAILLLAVILAVELTIISSKLNEIAKNLPQTPYLDGLEEILEEISAALGGKEKKKEMTKKKKAELKKRLIKSLINLSDGKKTLKQAKDEVEKTFEEAEFEETHGGLPRFDGLEDLAIRMEVEERNREKYGKFLDKARDYIKQKDKIFPHGRDRQHMADSIKTDYKGAGWLIEKLVEEGILEKIEEFNSKTGSMELKHYKVKKG